MLSVLGLDCRSEGADIEEKFVEQELLDEPDEEETGPDETPPAISEVGWDTAGGDFWFTWTTDEPATTDLFFDERARPPAGP